MAVTASNLRLKLFKRGKVRDIYELNERELLIYSTDRISAFDVVMSEGIPEKGKYLNLLSEFWFKRTRNIFPNHFLECPSKREMKVLRAQRIDVEWIARSYIYGSLWREYQKGRRVICGVRLPNGLNLAEELPETVVTPTTKAETGHDQEISKEQAIARGLVSREEWKELEEATFRLYEFYKREALPKGIILPDFKLEFGRLKGELLQIDEPPTHDSSRLWSKRHYEVGKFQEAHALDKEFLRQYLLRKGFTGRGKPPKLTSPVIEQIALRCRGAYEVLALGSDMEKLGLLDVDEVIAREASPAA